MRSRTGFEKFSISSVILHECNLIESHRGWGTGAFMYYRLSSGTGEKKTI